QPSAEPRIERRSEAIANVAYNQSDFRCRCASTGAKRAQIVGNCDRSDLAPCVHDYTSGEACEKVTEYTPPAQCAHGTATAAVQVDQNRQNSYGAERVRLPSETLRQCGGRRSAGTGQFRKSVTRSQRTPRVDQTLKRPSCKNSRG